MFQIKDILDTDFEKLDHLKIKDKTVKDDSLTAEYTSSKEDPEFKVLVNFELINKPSSVEATSGLTLVEKENDKIFKKFIFDDKDLKNKKEFQDFLIKIPKTVDNFMRKNLGRYNRFEFLNRMSKKKIISKTLAKLAFERKLTQKEMEDIVFKFVKREELDSESLDKKVKLTSETHDTLRKLYSRGDVKQLYTYGTLKFGFIFMGLRFDVNASYVEIKRLKGLK